uniref:Uncharacterized protein n=1 Tax=Anguilla anguilla TaxID=7936 RepID=A0A0E9UZ55_ANGAN
MVVLSKIFELVFLFFILFLFLFFEVQCTIEAFYM